MGARRRLTTAAALLAAAVVACAACSACSSCKRKEDSSVVENKPPDRLAPNEVVEGKERAFGLPLPQAARIKARFEKTVHVVTPLPMEDIANFVRSRVKDGTITPGTGSTELTNVVPLADPQKRLTIEVRVAGRSSDGARSEIIIRDTTPPPTDPGLSDEERWKKAGFTPDGRIADPQHLQ